MTHKNQINQQLKNLITERESHDIEQQIGVAGQIISEIEKVDSKNAFSLVDRRIQKNKITPWLINFISRVAAILFLPLLAASTWLIYLQHIHVSEPNFAMQEITSPLGVRSQVILPDGSAVWLNAESTIRFKVPFDIKSRNVELSGEAFFDVKKDNNRPFQVASGNLNITVLGTRFNIKAFEEDSELEIVLEEGKVRFNTSGNNKEQELFLNPGERAVIDKNSSETKISAEKIGKYIAWHTGKIVFDDCPMPQVVKQLERWFGIEVKIEDPKILTYKITTTFENEPLHQVLELLALSSPIKIDYIPAKIDKSNQIQSKAKVIITKK